ncbi:MAG: hypothetical protein J1E43_03050 [Christensenellaceae bacterium]|nr:hypothetical protein [Christensenellaceae bacterium]
MKRSTTPITDEQLEAKLKQLPEIVDHTFASLTADEALKRRIQRAVTNPEPAPVRRPAYRTLVPALSFALVLAVGAAIGIPALTHQQPDQLITSQAAGSPTDLAPGNNSDLSGGRVSITNGAVPEFRSLWETGDNGNFPLIGVNGSFYRMLTSPSSVSASLLGASLGTVAEFTTEPSLSGTDVILSNAASFGTEVYAVNGMNGTLVAAEVDGAVRLFQRVSFNGSALQGRETLADTLQIAGHITAMELSDVGVVTDRSACEMLFATLLDNASYDSSGSLSANQSLLIELDNGLTVQLAVRNDKLAACGTWSCPEFFEEFEEAME